MNARTPTLRDVFSRFASWSADLLGSAGAFVFSTFLTLLWAVSGPFFNYSDTWQLVINTATTVLTFLAVFLIQHTQNREGRALQLKLDELIRSSKDARNRLIDLEHCTDEEIKHLQAEFSRRNAPSVDDASHSSMKHANIGLAARDDQRVDVGAPQIQMKGAAGPWQ